MNALQDPREEVAALRLPPHSVEAEQSVLGGLLIDNSAWDRVADLVLEADFYRHEHQAIFAAIGRLISTNKPADVVTVFDALADKAADVGGLAYLNALAQSVPSASNVRRYAEIVRGRSMLRTVLGKVAEAAEIAHGDGEPGEKIDKIGALFAGIEARNSSREPQSMDALMVRVIDRLNEAAEGKVVSWRTGIHGLDTRLLGGLRPGKFFVIAARPGVGKTAIALQILANAARDGHACLMLSQEMENEELAQRVLSSRSRVDFGNIQTGRLNDQEWSRVAEAVDDLGKLGLHIDDEPALTLRAINAKARRIKGLRILAVDYLQLCEGEGETRTAQVGSISRGLKKLAKQLGICVIGLSQLNRSVETRPGKRPQMSDLRDSGEIEQDADVVSFLWPLDEEGHIGFDIAKNRQGRQGAMVMQFAGATQSWVESTRAIDSFDTKKRTGGFE